MMRIIADIVLTAFIIGVYVYSTYRFKKNRRANHPKMNWFLVVLNVICLILGTWLLCNNWLRV